MQKLKLKKLLIQAQAAILDPTVVDGVDAGAASKLVDQAIALIDVSTKRKQKAIPTV